jgi:hypothetical protein
VFYETKTRGGRGGAVGCAIVQDVAIDTPAGLFERFSDLGIYKLSDIEGHQNSKGRAMAIKFSIFEPFPHPVLLEDIRLYCGQNITVQGLTPISRDAFEGIRSQGLA